MYLIAYPRSNPRNEIYIIANPRSNYSDEMYLMTNPSTNPVVEIYLTPYLSLEIFLIANHSFKSILDI